MTLTQGYDLLISMQQKLPTDIVGAYWRAGIIPNYIRPDLPIPALANLELFLGSPRMTVLAADGETEQHARYEQLFLIRGDAIPNELRSNVSARIPFALTTTEIDGLPIQTFRCDLAAIANADIAFNGPDDVPLPVQGAIRLMLRTALGQGVVDLPLAPAMVGGPVYLGLSLGPPGEAIDIFANVDGGTAGFTTHVPSGDKQSLFDDKPARIEVYANWEFVHARIMAEFAARGLGKGTVIYVNKTVIDLSVDVKSLVMPGVLPEFKGLDLTLFDADLKTLTLTTPLTVALGIGVVNVSGSAYAVIDDWFDTDVDFSVNLAFSLGSGQLTAFVVSANVSVGGVVPNALSIALFGPLGPLLAYAIEAADEAVAQALVGQKAVVPLPVESIVVGGVTITNAQQSDTPITLNVVPTLIQICDDSIKTVLEVTAQGPDVTQALPAYLRGNRKSMQFHKPGCPYGGLISPANKVSFVRASEAIEEGYDGCRICLPQYDGQGAGRLTIRHVRPAPPQAKRGQPILVTGERLKGTGVAKFAAPFDKVGKFSACDSDGMWVDTIETGPLAPGFWKITVSDGEWSSTQEVGVAGGRSNSALFCYDRDPKDGLGVAEISLRRPAKKVPIPESELPVLTAKYVGGSPKSAYAQPRLKLAPVTYPNEDRQTFAAEHRWLETGKWLFTVTDSDGWTDTWQVVIWNTKKQKKAVLDFTRP